MQLTFLGTAAANAYPEAFCGCANCKQARALGGPSLRKRSAALVNDDLLIDLGPDIHTAAALHGRPLSNVRFCLQTHAHADHLDPSHLLSRSPAYGVVGAPQLQLYGSPATLGRLAEALARDMVPGSLFDSAAQEQLNVELHPAAPLAPFTVGPYTVLAIPANHDPSVEPLLYIIQSAGRCIFYGTDTAALPESTWQAFHVHRLRFDVVVLDHTYGPGHPGDDHLSSRDVAAYAARLRSEGLLAEGGRVLATHIAHDANPPHPELAAYAAAHGYEIAYDGLSV
ncbi:MAG TPA: MBL fold metallo-hydrolase [Chloroflexaceae bacterium]|nr:MBL fold metallo-hydrolase [Chloroflexaceae bacterium]